ncbi:MAG TPA: PPK2 family polyphosphate kinase [Candidatus Elarobacter sp.]|nr:PPK2 family polyphosphate kinase [Candidatus Elarobacter sp.]
MSFRSAYAVERGQRPDLEAIDAGDTGDFADEDAACETIARDRDRLRTLQRRLYAERRRSLLIVLQAPDAGGKDGAARHLATAVDPRGVAVHAFSVPTPEEAAHDFLWRVHKAVPAHGQIAVFNRSHYEDVLVPRVHGTLPDGEIAKRLKRIVDFEKLLAQNGTTIVKCYLHVTRAEQLRRLEARLDDPEKRWKVDPDDYIERARWDDYRAAYEDAIERTNRRRAPWFVIPANHKWFRNVVVTRIAIETLEAMDPQVPEPLADVEALRRRFHPAGTPRSE